MSPPAPPTVAILSQGRAAVFEQPVGPGGIRVRERPQTEPEPGAVAISIRAASVNHLDLWMAHGAQRVTPPRVIAADGAGVVHASTDGRWRPGDEVVVYPAISTARHLGARVFATSRSDDKRERAVELGAEAAFDSSEFSKPVREASGGGVDVVVESVGPATINESMRSLAPAGRLVVCGSTSGVKAEIAMPRLFWGQLDMLGSTMGNASEFEAVLKALDTGLRPVVDRAYPLDEVEAALTRLDAAEQFGKVVLTVS